MGDAQPNEFYNLGAISCVASRRRTLGSPPTSPATACSTLLEACRQYVGPRPDGGPASTRPPSSEMFGKVQESPARDDAALAARRPYGVAKVYAPLHDHQLTGVLRHACGSGHPVRPRVAPITARSRHPQGVEAVAAISLGLQAAVTLGDLDAKRDSGFAGDYVDGSGGWCGRRRLTTRWSRRGTHSIRDLLDITFAHVGIDDCSARHAGPALHAARRGRPAGRRPHQGA